MAEFKGIRRYLRIRWSDREAEEEVAEELRFHLVRKVEDLMVAGWSEEEARARALREFGEVEAIAAAVRAIDRARVRERRLSRWVDDLRQDLRVAFRGLRRAPGFALVATVTLALGIGGVTSIFTVLSGLLLRPLPYEGAERIVMLTETERARPERETTTSYAMFEELLASATSYEAIAVIDDWSPSLTGAGDPERLDGALVTWGAFPIFGVAPVLGRAMEPGDNVAGAERVAILSHGLWQRKFGGDRTIVGRSITINGGARTVIGVLPSWFRGAAEMDAEIWGNNWRDERDDYGSRSLRVYGRLKAGVGVAAARAEFAAIEERLEREQPRTNADMVALVTPLRDVLVGETKQPLVLVFGASLVLLLIACVNLSSLLIARGYARMREFAIRSALGASSRRAVRQLLTESLCLCVLGTAAGLVLAWWSQRTLLALAPVAVRSADVPLDWRVVIFVAVAVVLSALVTGLLPALRASRIDLDAVLKSGGRGTIGGGARLRKMLVAGQIALALALLAGAGLLVESFRRVQRVQAGIDPEGVLVLSMNLPAARYPGGSEPQFFERLLAEVRGLPGVRAAAVSSIVPFSSSWDRIVVDVEGWTIERGAEKPEGDRYIVSADYFRALGVPLRGGRLFDERDHHDGRLVAVVDELFARRIAGAGSPIGMRLRLPARDSMATVVGVVGHVKQYGLDASSQGQIYMSHVQYPWRWMVLAVKTSGDAAALAPAVREAIRSVDPDQPVFDVATMEQLMAGRLALRRFLLLLMTVFAVVAVTLATIGVYGALAYVVALRRPEIGMRAVLGAMPPQLVRMIVAEGMSVGLAGVALGLAGSAAATRLLRQLLFDVRPFEPGVMIFVVALVLGLSCAACLVPAWRAARVHPVEAIHSQ